MAFIKYTLIRNKYDTGIVCVLILDLIKSIKMKKKKLVKKQKILITKIKKLNT